MCSTVAFSPILAVHLATPALTACNYCQNHLLTPSIDVIGGASASAARNNTCVCVNQFLQIP